MQTEHPPKFDKCSVKGFVNVCEALISHYDTHYSHKGKYFF